MLLQVVVSIMNYWVCLLSAFSSLFAPWIMTIKVYNSCEQKTTKLSPQTKMLLHQVVRCIISQSLIYTFAINNLVPSNHCTLVVFGESLWSGVHFNHQLLKQWSVWLLVCLFKDKPCLFCLEIPVWDCLDFLWDLFEPMIQAPNWAYHPPTKTNLF
jgi:hypothetical protein